MKQEEINDYNRRCAEFLGYKLITPEMRKNPETWKISYWQKDYPNRQEVLCSEKYLSFDSDWNLIMKVVEAIEKLEGTNFYMEWFWLNGTNIALYQRHKQNGSNLWEFIARFSNAKTKKEAVVKAINQFLIWYKENK